MPFPNAPKRIQEIIKKEKIKGEKDFYAFQKETKNE